MKTLNVPDMKCANSICFSKDGSLMYHADTPTHKINVFPYKTDGSLGQPNLVKNYLVQAVQASYSTNVLRWRSALQAFYPHHKKFIKRVLSFILILLLIIFYKRMISVPKFIFGLLFIVALIPALPVKTIYAQPDGSIINSKDQIWNAVYFGKQLCLFEKNRYAEKYDLV